MTPLEALEILKEANTIYCDCASNLFARYRFEIETIENALKALDIIKEKEVEVGWFIMVFIKHDTTICSSYGYIDFTYRGYFDFFEDFSNKELTEKEFDLLKEVFLND